MFRKLKILVASLLLITNVIAYSVDYVKAHGVYAYCCKGIAFPQVVTCIDGKGWCWKDGCEAHGEGFTAYSAGKCDGIGSTCRRTVTSWLGTPINQFATNSCPWEDGGPGPGCEGDPEACEQHD